MKTSGWYIYKGPGRIGISVGTPRGMPAGYRLFRPLNPTRDMLDLPPEEYGPRYDAILAALDPQATWDKLHALAAPHEPVLLCFEKPPFVYPHNLCHRRRVADWFEATLGVDVPELDASMVAGQEQLPF